MDPQEQKGKESVSREPKHEQNEEKKRQEGNVVNSMIKKLYNKSPGKIHVKRNFMINQMGQETFKRMIS